MLAELAGQEGAQFVQCERCGAPAQLDEGLRRLAAVIVGDADRDHFVHGRVVLDLVPAHLWHNLRPTGDDLRLIAVDRLY